MALFTLIFPTCLYACLVCFKFAYGAGCEEGFQSKQDNFWYTCTKGKQVPVACISSEGDRVDEGSKYQTAVILYSCSKDPKDSSKLKMIPSSCISNGQPIDVDKTFQDDSNNMLKCVKDGDQLKLELIGCVGDDGKALKEGGTVVRDGVVYSCKTVGKGKDVQLAAQSCMFEGKPYKPDSIIESSGVWFKCEKSASGDLAVTIKGCMDNGTRYDVGKKFKDYYFVYECQSQEGIIMRVGVGCVERYPNGTITDYKPGDKWFVGKADNRYQITCIREGLIIRRRGIACYYKTKDGEGLIMGGCMRKVGFQILQCMPGTPATPNVRIRVTENPTDADWKRLRGLGLKEC